MPYHTHRATARIFNEDIFDILAAIPDDSIDMVYGDPDYNVGIQYAGNSYTTKWHDYVAWYTRLAQESMRVLAPDGNLFLLNYSRQNDYLRVLYLDDAAYDVAEYVWVYNSNVGHSPRKFTNAHRTILHATKTSHNRFYKQQVAQPYLNPEHHRIQRIIANNPATAGRMPYSWFEYNLVKTNSFDKTEHPCQIPTGLSQLLIEASTQPGDTIVILFGGSGSETLYAYQTGRRVITAELEPAYCRIIQQRINDGSAFISTDLDLQQ